MLEATNKVLSFAWYSSLVMPLVSIIESSTSPSSSKAISLLLAHAASLNNRIEHLPQVFVGYVFIFLMQHSVLFDIQAKGCSMPCVNLLPCTAYHKYCSYIKIFILALPNEWSLGKAEVKLHLYSRLNFISLS